MIEHITQEYLAFLRRPDSAERFDQTALNDLLDYIADRDAEIKRLKYGSGVYQAAIACRDAEINNMIDDKVASDAEVARLRAEVEKIEKAQKAWVLCNRGEKQPKVWSGTGAIQVFDSWAVAETVASSGKAFITNPFALVPVEDSVIVEDELKPRWDEKCCCEPGSGCSLCGGDSTPKAEDKP